MMQIDSEATKTHTLATVLCQLIQSSAVVVDPAVYIIYHEKYRKAIKRVLYGCVNEKLLFMKTGEELTTLQSHEPIRKGTNDIEKGAAQYPTSLNSMST